jgi:HAD superfamily hydrolase (TIGR01450 family)
MDLLRSYRAVVCDLDGVVYRGPLAVPHAVEALRACDLPVLYATNNASRTPATVVEHLVELGLTAGPGDVVTSAQAGAHVLAGQLSAGAAVLAVGGEGVVQALAEEGLRPVPVRGARHGGPVAAVLQGYGADLTASDLAEAAYAVQAGARWVATNTDRTLPTDRGTAPGNGTLVAAVEAAVGHPPVVVGKPHAPLYLLCAERVHHAPEELLAVGDRLDTDIAGAVETGMDSVLVLTGVDSATSLATAPPSRRPTYLVEDLRSLHTAYRPAQRDADGWWACGGDRRRVADGQWKVDVAGGNRIERLRAAVAAVHEALDAGDVDDDVARSLVSEVDNRQ